MYDRSNSFAEPFWDYRPLRCVHLPHYWVEPGSQKISFRGLVEVNTELYYDSGFAEGDSSTTGFPPSHYRSDHFKVSWSSVPEFDHALHLLTSTSSP